MGLFKNFHVINNVLFLSASHGKILTSSSYIMFLISHFFGSMVVSNGSVILAKKNVKTAEQRSTYLLISDFQPIVFIHDCTAYDPAPLQRTSIKDVGNSFLTLCPFPISAVFTYPSVKFDPFLTPLPPPLLSTYFMEDPLLLRKSAEISKECLYSLYRNFFSLSLLLINPCFVL